MFSYISSSKFNHALQVSRLCEEKTENCLHQVAEWIENKWGYLRNYPGLDKRKVMTRALADEMYLLKYAGQPIGMFRLCDAESVDAKTTVKELTHVYIDESFRSMGIAGRMLGIAKNIAKSQGANLIVFDTLNPNLNRFYEKNGASVVCESKFLGAPSERLRMTI